MRPAPLQARSGTNAAERYRRRSRAGRRRHGYILLETVLATGLLLLGLAVIGGQVRAARHSLDTMELRLTAMQLAESHLNLLALGLIELDSVDEEQEEEFGPRYPDFGWRLTLNETATEALVLLRLDVLRFPREDVDEDFDFDEAEILYTVYALRPVPAKLDLASEFGLTEEEMEELSEKLGALNVDGLSAGEFDPSIFAKLDFEELIEVLPPLLEAFGIPLESLTSQLPPDVLQALEEEGILGGEGEEGAGDLGDRGGR